MVSLFDPFQLGPLTLKNRIVMAPMTRCRALGNVANELMANYYELRAAAGLIISEGISPSPHGLGYARIPGLFNQEQAKSWKIVTDRVHKKNGKIFAQLMHAGRVAHGDNLPAGAIILGPSAVASKGTMWTDAHGLQPIPTPKAMTTTNIDETIKEYGQSCKLALEAGFDGVELHGANGYLIDQFLNTAANQRRDEWGGSVENRIRFAVEVAKAACTAIGAARVGMRISPYGVFNDMAPDEDMDELYEKLIEALSGLGLSYIHIVDHSSMGAPEVKPAIKSAIRKGFKQAYILSGGYDVPRANADLTAKKGDLVAFGRPFIANPDLVEKLRANGPLITPDPTTFYSPGAKGYTEL